MSIKKLLHPLVIKREKVYPLTTADQIIKSNGERLENDNGISVDNANKLNNKTESELSVANASTINGKNINELSFLEGGSSIPNNTDLNTYTNIGNYYCHANTNAATLINLPANKEAFTLKVENSVGNPQQGTYLYRKQTLSYFRIEAGTYIRTASTENGGSTWTWTKWVKIKDSQEVPFKFGIDANGNYGYIKDGADTVTPFKQLAHLKQIYHYIQPSAQNGTHSFSIGEVGTDQALIVSWFKYTGTGTEGSGNNVYNWIESVTNATFTRLLGVSGNNTGMVFDIGLLTNITGPITASITHNQSNIHANLQIDIFTL